MSSIFDWTVRPDAVGISNVDIITGRLNPFCTDPAFSTSIYGEGGNRRNLQTSSVFFDRSGHNVNYRDAIAPSVVLGRASNGCLYNAAAGESTGKEGDGHGPIGTHWTLGSFADVGVESPSPPRHIDEMSGRLSGPEPLYGSFCVKSTTRRDTIGDDLELSRSAQNDRSFCSFFPMLFGFISCENLVSQTQLGSARLGGRFVFRRA